MQLSPAIIQLLTRALEDSGGREICAVLLENVKGDQAAVRVPNWSRDFDSFFVARSEIKRIERYAERNGYKILAFIHSHRSSLELSDTDRMSLEHSNYPWVIVILSDSGLHTRFYESLAQSDVGLKEEIQRVKDTRFK